MQAKTHVAVGTAVALAILHPINITGITSVVTGGVMGGWIVDIDNRTPAATEETPTDILNIIIKVIALLIIDAYFGDGLIDYVTNNLGIPLFLGLALIILGCIAGYYSGHRSFTHSLIGFVIFSVAVFLFCRPVAYAFSISYICHILLDLITSRKIRLLYPLKVGFCLNMCSSQGKVDYIIRGFAKMIWRIEVCILGIAAFLYEEKIKALIVLIRENAIGSLSWFQCYLISINIIMVLLFIIDWIVMEIIDSRGGDLDRYQYHSHYFLSMIGVLGAPLIVPLILVLFTVRDGIIYHHKSHIIGKDNAGAFAVYLSWSLIWSVIYFVVMDPFRMALQMPTQWIIQEHMPLIVYFSAVNIISFFLFFLDKDNHHPKWSSLETMQFMSAFLGGAIAANLVRIVTGAKKATPHFSYGIQSMISAHTIVVGYLLLTGIG